MAGKSKLTRAIDELEAQIEAAVRDISVAQAELSTLQRVRATLVMTRDAKPKAATKRAARPGPVGGVQS